MFDVLAYLFEQYRDPAYCEDRSQLMHQLGTVGFEKDDIQDALDWLFQLFQIVGGQYSGADNAHSIRIYAALEQKHLTVQIRGLIQFLEEQGVLSGAQREVVIDRLLALSEHEITVSAAKLVTLIVLWVQKAELPILIAEELLDGLHGDFTMQ